MVSGRLVVVGAAVLIFTGEVADVGAGEEDASEKSQQCQCQTEDRAKKGKTPEDSRDGHVIVYKPHTTIRQFHRPDLWEQVKSSPIHFDCGQGGSIWTSLEFEPLHGGRAEALVSE